MNSAAKTPIPLLSGVNLDSAFTRNPLALLGSSGVVFTLRSLCIGVLRCLSNRGTKIYTENMSIQMYCYGQTTPSPQSGCYAYITSKRHKYLVGILFTRIHGFNGKVESGVGAGRGLLLSSMHVGPY